MTKARDLADRTAADITAVTAGTGIAVTSGAGPIPTVAVTSSIVTLTDTQTLTNKTLTSPLIETGIFRSPEERWTIAAVTTATSVNFDALTQGALYYTNVASSNWTLNVRGNSSTTLNSMLAVGDAITVSFLVTNGATARYQTAFQIDATTSTVSWSGGTAPASGNASSVDAYSFTIVKTAATPTYTVFGAGPVKYA